MVCIHLLFKSSKKILWNIILMLYNEESEIKNLQYFHEQNSLR